jgi:RHS repeat-associated protein
MPPIRFPHGPSPNGDAARARRRPRLLSAEAPIGRGATTAVAYTHEARNRLVGVEYGQTVRGSYVYNGLNWRIMKQADTDGTGGPDQQRLMHYSDRWQLLEEDVWDAWTEQTPGDIDRHVQYVWGYSGGRYIDDIILRREDRDADGDYELETDDIARYYLTDAQFTPVAIIDDGADVIERTSYMPYGHARHHRMADLNGDGKTNTADQLLLLGNWGNFGVGDLDRSGAVGSGDLTALLGDWSDTALPAGQISYDSEDNQIGYCGYVFDRETQDYTVRNRHYSPDLGRWLERDPAGYVDGMGLYIYVTSNPLGANDPMGRWGEGVHYRATWWWARWWGFNEKAAKRVGEACDEVDDDWDPKWASNYPIHFDIVGGATGTGHDTVRAFAVDSRGIWSAARITLSNTACGAGKWKDALRELGRALHPIGDYYAHGNWDPIVGTLHPLWYDYAALDGSGLNGIPIRSADDRNNRFPTEAGAPYRVATGGKGIPGRQRYRATSQHTDNVLATWISTNAAAGNCACLCKVLEDWALPPACGGKARNVPRTPAPPLPAVAISGFTLR